MVSCNSIKSPLNPSKRVIQSKELKCVNEEENVKHVITEYDSSEKNEDLQ